MFLLAFVPSLSTVAIDLPSISRSVCTASGFKAWATTAAFSLREGHRPCGGRTRIRHDINRIPGIFRECAPVLRNAVPGHSVDRHDALVMGAGVFSSL